MDLKHYYKQILVYLIFLAVILATINIPYINYIPSILLKVFILIFYILIPFALAFFLLLYFLQFIKRDYKKYSNIMRLLFNIYIIGYFVTIFLSNELILNYLNTLQKIILISYVLIAYVINEQVYKKNDTRYYILCILLVIIFMLMGCEFEQFSL